MWKLLHDQVSARVHLFAIGSAPLRGDWCLHIRTCFAFSQSLGKPTLGCRTHSGCASPLANNSTWNTSLATCPPAMAQTSPVRNLLGIRAVCGHSLSGLFDAVCSVRRISMTMVSRLWYHTLFVIDLVALCGRALAYKDTTHISCICLQIKRTLVTWL